MRMLTPEESARPLEAGEYQLGPGSHTIETRAPVRIVGTQGAVVRKLSAYADLALDEVDFDVPSGRGLHFNGRKLEVNGGTWRLGVEADGLVFIGAQGELRRVIISGGQRQAVVQTGTLVVRESRFDEARAACVATISQGARAEVHDCRAQRSHAALCSFDGATLVVRGARLEASVVNGVCVSGGAADIERLVLEGSGDAGITVGERSTFRLVDAEISGCKRFGLQAAATVHLERVRLANNDVGLGLYGETAQHRLVDVVAEDSKEGGLFAYWGTSLWAVRCISRRNRDAGLELAGRARARSFDGTYERGLTFGVQARDGAEALLVGGSISRNTDGAVDAAQGHALLLGTSTSGELRNTAVGDSGAWRNFVAAPHAFTGELPIADRLRLATWAIGRALAGDLGAPALARRLQGPDVGDLCRSVVRSVSGVDDGLFSTVKYYVDNYERSPTPDVVAELQLVAAEDRLEPGDLDALAKMTLTRAQQARAVELAVTALAHASEAIANEGSRLWKASVPGAAASNEPGIARMLGRTREADPAVFDDLRALARKMRPIANEDDAHVESCLRGEMPDAAALTSAPFDLARSWALLHALVSSDDPVTRWTLRSVEARILLRPHATPLPMILAVRKHRPLLLLRDLAEREARDDGWDDRERRSSSAEPGPYARLLAVVDPDGDAIAALCGNWLRRQALLDERDRVSEGFFRATSAKTLEEVSAALEKQVVAMSGRFPALASHLDATVEAALDFSPVWPAYRIATAADATRAAVEERERWPLLHRRGPVWTRLAADPFDADALRTAAREFLSGLAMPAA